MPAPKNLSKEAIGPVAMEMGVQNMEGSVRSGNLGSYAHEMPLENNMKREKMHMGAMPPKGSGKF